MLKGYDINTHIPLVDGQMDVRIYFETNFIGLTDSGGTRRGRLIGIRPDDMFTRTVID